MLSLPRAWVQSLVRELRSRKPHSVAKAKKIEVAHCSIIYGSIKQEQNQSIYQEGISHVNRLKHDTEQAQAKWDENSKWPKRLKV